jgi:diguanylate cyclase (GGDEF)-like protein
MRPANAILPTKLKYVLLVSFCLMTLIPMLAGAYAASLIMRAAQDKGEPFMFVVSAIGLFSLLIAYLGFMVVKQLLMPIVQVKLAAENIAAGHVDKEPDMVDSADEIQDLTRSLQRISKNAKELLDKVERLSLRDKLTGLYNAAYIRERLDEEIQRAIHYQRPCSFAFFMIRNLDEYAAQNGERACEEALRKIAGVLNGEIREFDRAARVGRGEFVIVLPDKNKKKCIEMAERIMKGVSGLGLKPNPSSEEVLSVCAGVSENPIDGVHADSLYIKAQDRMRAALQQDKVLEAFI